MAQNEYVRGNKCVAYHNGLKFVSNEPFTYVNKDGEEKNMPAQVKIIGMGYKIHPTITAEAANFFMESSEDPGVKAFLEKKKKNKEDIKIREGDGWIWIH